jgi:ankyrin repeat protein
LKNWARSKSLFTYASEFLNYVDLEDIIDDQDFTSLHRIILGLTCRNLKEEIQEHPEIINATDTMSRTPLWWATHIGDVVSSEILLSFGADPSKGDFEKFGPLHNSAWPSSKSLVEMLLNCGVEVNAVTADERTSLHLCYSNDDVDAARILLDHGADCNARDNMGRTPLHRCATDNSYLFAEFLLQRGADQNIADKDGGRPWQTAVKHLAARVLRVLSRHGCHFTDTERDLSTVLHIAARYGDMAVAQTLKEIDLSHIDADATDKYGFTAEDDLELRYHGDRLQLGWPVCSAESYAALEDLIAHVRASNRRVHEVADSDGDTDDEERSYSDGGTEDEEERSYSNGDTEDEEERSFEDAREEWESPCPHEDLHGEPHDTNILSTPKGS